MLPSLLTQLSNIDRIAEDFERQLPERLRECPFKWIGHGCQKPGDLTHLHSDFQEDLLSYLLLPTNTGGNSFSVK